MTAISVYDWFAEDANTAADIWLSPGAAFLLATAWGCNSFSLFTVDMHLIVNLTSAISKCL